MTAKMNKTVRDLAIKHGVSPDVVKRIEKEAEGVRVGRPSLSSEDKRRVVTIRANASELAEIDRRAAAMGMNRSEYLIHAALKFKPRSKK